MGIKQAISLIFSGLIAAGSYAEGTFCHTISYIPATYGVDLRTLKFHYADEAQWAEKHAKQGLATAAQYLATYKVNQCLLNIIYTQDPSITRQCFIPGKTTDNKLLADGTRTILITLSANLAFKNISSSQKIKYVINDQSNAKLVESGVITQTNNQLNFTHQFVFNLPSQFIADDQTPCNNGVQAGAAANFDASTLTSNNYHYVLIISGINYKGRNVSLKYEFKPYIDKIKITPFMPGMNSDKCISSGVDIFGTLPYCINMYTQNNPYWGHGMALCDITSSSNVNGDQGIYFGIYGSVGLQTVYPNAYPLKVDKKYNEDGEFAGCGFTTGNKAIALGLFDEAKYPYQIKDDRGRYTSGTSNQSGGPQGFGFYGYANPEYIMHITANIDVNPSTYLSIRKQSLNDTNFYLAGDNAK